jgi:hypothetical protein
MGLEHKEENDPLITNEEKEQTQWKSCCWNMDSRLCRFAVCMIVSEMTLVAALYKLVTDPSCDTYGFWGPILSLIIGIWTPTPKKSKNP